MSTSSTSASVSMESATRRKETWTERWAMPMLGVPKKHFEVLENTGAASKIGFQAVALLVLSVGFALNTWFFGRSLLENDVPASLLMAVAAGFGLFVIYRQTLIDLRLDPKGGRAWAIRVATVFMALLMSLLTGVETNKDDIARLQAKNRDAEAATALAGTEIAPIVTARQEDLAQATKDVARKALLMVQLTTARNAETHAKTNLNFELQGIPSPEGKRIAGRGAKAIYWEETLGAANQKVKTIQEELDQLQNPAQRQADAHAALKLIKDTAMTEAGLQQRGASKRLEGLVQLLKEEWTAWLSVGYAAALALLPEVMMLRAVYLARTLALDCELLIHLEHQHAQAKAVKLAGLMKRELASSTEATVVRVRTPPRKASHSYDGIDARLTGAMA